MLRKSELIQALAPFNAFAVAALFCKVCGATAAATQVKAFANLSESRVSIIIAELWRGEEPTSDLVYSIFIHASKRFDTLPGFQVTVIVAQNWGCDGWYLTSVSKRMTARCANSKLVLANTRVHIV